MLKTPGKTQNFTGSNPSSSPTILAEGVFSLCSGGTPNQGALCRLPGKTLRDIGIDYGGVISIYQLGKNVVVQRFGGLQLYKLSEVNPNESDFVTDNNLFVITDSNGLPLTA